jgi:hypothetical protein
MPPSNARNNFVATNVATPSRKPAFFERDFARSYMQPQSAEKTRPTYVRVSSGNACGPRRGTRPIPAL